MSQRIQCKACPWKVGVVPERDIPGGYSVDRHRNLACTIAAPGDLRGSSSAMACHESTGGREIECVGWVINQLGPGNNIGLRMRALDGRYRGFRVVGPQHGRFEDTLPKRRRRAKRAAATSGEESK